MNNKNIAVHIQILGWLMIISNAILLLIGLFALFFLPALGLVADDPIAVRALGTIGAAGAVFFSLLALPGMIAGAGLLMRKPWARILALVCAFFDLLNFPVGTVFGIYAFWVLLQSESEEFFSPLKAV